MRAIVVCEPGRCRLYSRNQREVTGSYPELAADISMLASGRVLVLDGEVIAQTANGTPSFGLLQRRMNVERPGVELIRTVPVQLYVFCVWAVIDLRGTRSACDICAGACERAVCGYERTLIGPGCVGHAMCCDWSSCT